MQSYAVYQSLITTKALDFSELKITMNILRKNLPYTPKVGKFQFFYTETQKCNLDQIF